MEKELSAEQIKMQEIVATTWTPGWQYITDDFKAKLDEYEALIHDIDIDDTPRYSQRSILVVMSNSLKAFIEKPDTLLDELKSYISK